MRKHNKILTAGILTLLGATSVPTQAVISVTSGTTTLTFNAAPGAGDWSTIAAGFAATTTGATYTNTTQLDAAVAALTAGGITAALPTSGTNPPSSNTAGRYNTSLQLLQSRSTGLGASVLLGRLSNAELLGFTDLKIEYDLQRWSAAVTEQIEGFRVYFSTTGLANSWVNVPMSLSNGGIASTVATQSTFATAGWSAGGNAFLMFVDDNADPGTDDAFTIDNLKLTPTLQTGVQLLKWNVGHAVGGAPGGVFEISGNTFWNDATNANAPSGFANGGIAAFDQDTTTASISVPADVAPQTLAIQHAAGTYEFSGAGKIQAGLMTKTGAGVVRFGSENAFTTVKLNGGTTITEHSAALGVASSLTVDGASTLTTTNPLTIAGGIAGVGPLTKDGAGALTVSAGNAITGTVNVNAGKLILGQGAGFSSAASVINLNTGGSLEINSPAAATTIAGNINFNDAATAIIRVDAVAESGLSASGLTISKANAITTVGPIEKAGNGTVRIAAAQTLTNNWTITGGFLEAQNAGSFGTGTITANAGWVSITGVTITNPIVLNGGGIGVRSGAPAAPVENYAGPVSVIADSFLTPKRTSTFANYNGYFLTGALSGSNSLTVTGPIVAAQLVAPFTPENTPVNPNIANTTTTVGAVTLTNTANSFSGAFVVNSEQIISALPSGGTGDVFGTAASFTLKGGAIRILDNGTGNDGTITYNHPIIVAAPNDAVNPGVATVFVDRQTNAAAPAGANLGTQGTFTGNTVEFPSLTLLGGQGFRTMGLAANGAYRVKISGVTNATGSGNVTINTDTAPLELAGGLTGSVNLVKQGASILKINGAAHTGNTTVTAGTLELTNVGGLTVGAGQTLSGAGGTVTGLLAVSGGTVAPGDATGVGTLNVSNLALSNNAALNYSWTAGNLGLINVTGTDTLTGSAKFNIAGIEFPTTFPVTRTLIDYVGTALSQGVVDANFTINSINTRLQHSIVSNTADTRIELTITALNFPIWTGTTSSEWSTNPISGDKNWVLNVGGPDDFITNDKVLFDDSAIGTGVNISVADVTPSSVEVNNPTQDYTFNGGFGIAGATPFVKNGAAKATINNTNSFTGPVTINQGIVSVPTVSDSTVAGTLGAGNTVNLSGGTLEFTGAAGTTNRAITLGAAGGSVSATTGSALTLAGVVGPVGGGPLTKTGAGTVILTGLTNAVSAVTVAQGTLQIGDGTALGSIGDTAPVTIASGATLAFNTPTAGTLAVPNAISGAGGLNKTGPGTLTLNGAAVANTFTGDTVVDGGALILSHTTATDSIGGNLVVNGGTVSYGGTAGQLADHIPATASITVTGGTFGGTSGRTVDNPLTGLTETAASVSISGGTFLSGRNDAGTFALSGAFNATGGTTILQRGGSVTASSITLNSGATISFDGGSTGFASRMFVGSGGLTLNGATINLNAGPSAIAAGSRGSLITLGGNVTVSTSTTLNRINTTELAPLAGFDVNGGDREINIAAGQALTLGTLAAPVGIVNTSLTTPGGIVKDGAGDLNLNGANTYNGDTIIRTGKIILTGTLSGSANIDVQSGTELNVEAIVGGYPLGAAQTLKGFGTVRGDVIANGTISPGASIGALTFTDDLTFGAGGIANFEVKKAGVTLSNDEAFVTNMLTLGGTLNIGLELGSDPLAEGDTFDLFDAGTFAGTMALGTTGLPSNLTWNLDNLGVDGTITVIPEPGSAALLVLGSTLLFRRRRKA